MNTKVASYEVDAFVQECIQGTNGTLYKNLIGKLSSYPIPDIPIPHALSSNSLFLDIGVGWGRWMAAAAQKGYLPLGIDIKLESCVAANKVLKQLGHNGLTVQADLRYLPFKNNIFDYIWSFSVLQHTHRSWVNLCIQEIKRILSKDASCMLEFPIRNGIRNSLFIMTRKENEEDIEDSWCVRYYSINELEKLFTSTFKNFNYQAHCYFGIGILEKDLEYVSNYYKPIVYTSLWLTKLSNYVSPLRKIADSLYVSAKQDSGVENPAKHLFVNQFNFSQDSTQNIEALTHILLCPITQSNLIFDKQNNILISEKGKLFYPIEQGVPILLKTAAKPM